MSRNESWEATGFVVGLAVVSKLFVFFTTKIISSRLIFLVFYYLSGLVLKYARNMSFLTPLVYICMFCIFRNIIRKITIVIYIFRGLSGKYFCGLNYYITPIETRVRKTDVRRITIVIWHLWLQPRPKRSYVFCAQNDCVSTTMKKYTRI